MNVSDASGSTLDDKSKSESAGGEMVTEGTESLTVDEGREGRRSTESPFLLTCGTPTLIGFPEL